MLSVCADATPEEHMATRQISVMGSGNRFMVWASCANQCFYPPRPTVMGSSISSTFMLPPAGAHAGVWPGCSIQLRGTRWILKG